jgi:intracellular sulfur oxidation DsrE/DsrF family protein
MGLAVLAGGRVLAAEDEPLKVVVHINFAESGRHGQGLKNIENVLREVGDKGAVVEVVCHGGGIGLVESARSDHAAQVSGLIGRGVKFVACRNTMKQKSIKPEDLIPGVETVGSGAVEVIRKQQEGYAYFRP